MSDVDEYGFIIEKSLREGMKIAGIMISGKTHYVVDDVSGLVALPKAINTRVGVLRFYREPNEGELVDCAGQPSYR